MKQLRLPTPRNWIVAWLFWLTLLFTFGCNRKYYQVSPKSFEEITAMPADTLADRYVIIHQGKEHYHLQHIRFGSDWIGGKLTPVNESHQNYRSMRPGKTKSFFGSQNVHVQKEIHLVLQEEPPFKFEEIVASSSEVLIPIESLDRVEVYTFDEKKTQSNKVITAVGISVATILVAAAIISIASASDPEPTQPTEITSCPYVYAFNGQSYQLVGDLFPGALLPNLERTDYILLADQEAKEGKQVIQLRNELEEVQHINQLELLAVRHRPGLKVRLDQHGSPHALGATAPPTSATLSSAADVLPLVANQDQLAYAFHDMEEAEQALLLSFDRPDTALEGKLILRARNTPWLQEAWEAFVQQFGRQYEKRFQKLGEKPSTFVESWMLEQNLPLTVELLTSEGWTTVSEQLLVGSLVWRDLVVPLDLRQVRSPDIHLRLRSAFLTWELDAAGMDFSADPPLETRVYPVQRTTAPDGTDPSDLLREADTSYLALHSGEQMEVWFPYEEPPPGPGTRYSCGAKAGTSPCTSSPIRRNSFPCYALSARGISRHFPAPGLPPGLGSRVCGGKGKGRCNSLPQASPPKEGKEYVWGIPGGHAFPLATMRQFSHIT